MPLNARARRAKNLDLLLCGHETCLVSWLKDMSDPECPPGQKPDIEFYETVPQKFEDIKIWAVAARDIYQDDLVVWADFSKTYMMELTQDISREEILEGV